MRSLLLPLAALLVAFSLLFSHSSSAQNYTVIGHVWNDANCDGIRQATELPLPGVEVNLIGQGSDRQIFTGDDRHIELSQARTPDGQFSFTRGGPYGDLYAVVIYNADKPAGYVPAPHMQGADRAIDNDLYLPLADRGSPLWATTAFEMHADRTTVMDIDIGLAPAGACSNGGGGQPITYDYQLYLPLVKR